LRGVVWSDAGFTLIAQWQVCGAAVWHRPFDHAMRCG
jgi:hypothetical protein